MRNLNKPTHRFLLLLLVIILTSAISASVPSAKADTGASDPVVKLTKHVQLGLSTSIPFTAHPTDSFAGVFSYDVSFTGTATISADIEADITLSYNSGDLTLGNNMPVSITYTPTSSSSTAGVNIAGSATFNSFTFCSDCPKTLPVTLASGSSTFTGPMGLDPPVTIPGSSSTFHLKALGVDFIDLDMSSALILAPASAGLFPGLGGAAAVVQVAGATLSSSPFLEWDSSGQSLTGSIMLPSSSLANGVDIMLQPVLHWVSTSGSANLNIHFTGAMKAVIVGLLGGPLSPPAIAFLAAVSDPSPIGLFSGSLGPVYTTLGVDTMIGNAVGPPAGSLVASRVASGFVPLPLLSPALSTIPPLNLGQTTFSIPGVAISGTPSEAVLAGSSINLAATVNRGSSPFTYSWTKNGAPFSSSQSITDTSVVGTTTYAVTVTDSAGAISNTDTTTINGYDFSISLSPPTETVPFGASATYSVTVVLTGGGGLAGVPASVSTSILGLPGAATTSGYPSTMPLSTSPASTTFTVDTSTSTPVGTYALTAKGATSTGSRTGTTTLVVITPAQALQNLLNSINSMNLPMGTMTSLDAPLKQAIALILADKDTPACNKLNAFEMLVATYLSQGKLTASQASQFTQQADLLKQSLGCT